jgi:hypothetical protein
MSNINQISIRQQVINLSPIHFINSTDKMDNICLVMNNEKKLFLQNMYCFNKISAKILKKPHNKILKRRLSEVDINEKIIFRMKIFNSTCIYSKYHVYFGELTLNQDKNGYFRLEIYKKNKQSIYVKDYEIIHSYVSII